MRRLMTLVALLALCVAGRPLAPADAASPVSLQHCADLWNAMHLHRGPAPARVIDSVRCQVTIDYGYRQTTYDKPDCGAGYTTTTGRTPYCLSKVFALACKENSFHAFLCPNHADDPVPAKGWNAAVDSHGLLQLDQPPTGSVHTTLPTWVSRYPVQDGYIKPWTSAGTMRPGVTTAPGEPLKCQGRESSFSVVAPSALRCFGPDHPQVSYIYDPCFAQHAIHGNDPVTVLCATAPGSTRFLVSQALPDGA